MIINRVKLSKRRDCFCGSHKLDGMNIIIQLNVQDNRSTSETIPTNVLHGQSFQMLQKILRIGRT